MRQGVWFFLFTLACTSVVAAKAPVTASPPRHIVFIGRVISTTIRPVNHSVDTSRGGGRAPDAISIDLRCAVARTTYGVFAQNMTTSRRIVVRSALGEWCDLPAGIDGSPVLVEVTRYQGGWRLEHAYAFQASNDQDPILIPDDDATICGMRLWSLRSPLVAQDQVYADAKVLGKERVVRFLAQGIVRKDSDDSLVYSAAIRMRDMMKAVADSPCRIGE